MSLNNTQAKPAIPLHERIVGVILYMLGLTITNPVGRRPDPAHRVDDDAADPSREYADRRWRGSCDLGMAAMNELTWYRRKDGGGVSRVYKYDGTFHVYLLGPDQQVRLRADGDGSIAIESPTTAAVAHHGDWIVFAKDHTSAYDPDTFRAAFEPAELATVPGKWPLGANERSTGYRMWK